MNSSQRVTCSTLGLALTICLSFFPTHSAPAQSLNRPEENRSRSNWIDFNPDNGRSDVRTPILTNWPIASGSTVQQTIEGIQVTINAVGNSDAEFQFGWWKAGYDSGATLCSDGISTKSNGDGLEITLQGFSPGKHSLASWHNRWDGGSELGQIEVQTLVRSSGSDSQLQKSSVSPSQRVSHDDDSRTHYAEFTIESREDVFVMKLLPTDPNQSVVLNGLAWDLPNPAFQAIKHWPVAGDEHVPVNPKLNWQAPRTMVNPLNNGKGIQYHLYFGTDRDTVATASRVDPSFSGVMQKLHADVAADDCTIDYFWRVDCEQSDGAITKGTTRRFKIRELAFPGAEGYGRFAIGGRGGRVLEVTNLLDAGPGSLRAAIEAEGPRTIVFRTGGTIQLKSKLLIRNPYVTIAGQTAPGDGICVRGYTFGCFGTHDVIMRYIRIRVGDEAGETMDGTGFASTDHSIFDHCSISWSIDEAVSSRSARNITLQRCIIAEALNVANHRKYQAGKGHSFAGSISGNIGSFHHNLLAHCAGRNWSLAGGLDGGGHFAGRLDIRNNVVYNWEHRTNDGGVKALNLVNNLYLPGPASRVFHLLKPDVGSPTDPQQYFVSGNRMEGRFGPEDNWRDAVVVDRSLTDAIRLREPFCEAQTATHDTFELLDSVLNDVGANRPGMDSVDQRVVDNVRQRSVDFKGSRTGIPGIIDSQTDVGGWPDLEPGQPPLDTDHDGLPDSWEALHGLNPMSADQNVRTSSAHPTALEDYLAELGQSPSITQSKQ